MPCDASADPEGRPVAETANAFFFGSWIAPNTNNVFHFNFPRNMSTQRLFPEATSAYLHTDGVEYQVPCFIPGDLLSFFAYRVSLNHSPIPIWLCLLLLSGGRIRAGLARNRMSRAIFTFRSQRRLHAPLSKSSVLSRCWCLSVFTTSSLRDIIRIDLKIDLYFWNFLIGHVICLKHCTCNPLSTLFILQKRIHICGHQPLRSLPWDFSSTYSCC